jgi:hypothetical protein
LTFQAKFGGVDPKPVLLRGRAERQQQRQKHARIMTTCARLGE